jgi:hypothetical protein
VDGAGVSVGLREIRQHGRQNFGRDRSGGVMVEINSAHVFCVPGTTCGAVFKRA